MPHYHREPFLHLADRLGAAPRIRTENLLITNQLRCQLRQSGLLSSFSDNGFSKLLKSVEEKCPHRLLLKEVSYLFALKHRQL